MSPDRLTLPGALPQFRRLRESAGIDGVLYRSPQLDKSDQQDVLRLIRHQQLVDLTLGWLLKLSLKHSHGGR